MAGAAPDEEADKLRRKHLARFLQVSGGKSRKDARDAIAAMKRLDIRAWYIADRKINDE